jgi:hypothetical protein
MEKVTDFSYLALLSEYKKCSRTEQSNFVSSIFLFATMSTGCGALKAFSFGD